MRNIKYIASSFLFIYHLCRSLISKVLVGRGVNYALVVDASSITLTYLPATSSTPISVTVSALSLDQKYWQHITLAVLAEDAAFYVNGSLVAASRLQGQILDEFNGDIKLGVLGDGK